MHTPSRPTDHPHHLPRWHLAFLAPLLALLLAGSPSLWAAGAGDPTVQCSAQSAARVAPVVELYTSEGCSSCPPADRWLSSLKLGPDAVALAFHVDYWDRLGWKDRFASPAYTQRQAQHRQSNGARFSYTPQVVVDGRDQPDWHALPAREPWGTRATAHVAITLSALGGRYTATVRPEAGAPARLAAYWAVTESGHTTTVKAGENDGATLSHDHVVRALQAVSAWVAEFGNAVTLNYQPATPASTRARQLNLVVVDADTGRPVQALKLGC